MWSAVRHLAWLWLMLNMLGLILLFPPQGAVIHGSWSLVPAEAPIMPMLTSYERI